MLLAIALMAFIASSFQCIMHHLLGYQIAMATGTGTTSLAGIYLPAGAEINASQYYQYYTYSEAHKC
jgi:multisubunit Na+/H+ antiporter MnhB subunit